MQNYLKFEPVATLAALQGLVQTIILMVAFRTGMDAETLILTEGIQASLFLFFATFVRGQVVPTATLDKLVALSADELAELVLRKELDER